MTAPAIIEIEHLSKVYRPKRSGPVTAVRDVTLSIENGQFISIVGPSGCGKTTVLNVMAGLVTGYDGVARLDGQDITGPNPDVGVVFQAPTLLPWRTVEDNILLPIDLRRERRRDFRERARALMDLVGLAGFHDKYPNELSGGMQQRAGICRALIHDPKVLLMDEPFGALDAMTREFMNNELQRIWMESLKTVVFVTHSIDEAIFLADRVVVMTARPGQIAEVIDVPIERPHRVTDLSSEAAASVAQRIRSHINPSSLVDLGG